MGSEGTQLPAVAAGGSHGSEKGRGQLWPCQHESAPPQASRSRRSPPFYPSVASNRLGHQFPGQEQQVQGPHELI